MAFGLPIIANDNPDQMQVLKESGAGNCVELSAEKFAKAVLGLINDEVQKKKMAQQGLIYVHKIRGYDILAEQLADRYRQLLQ